MAIELEIVAPNKIVARESGVSEISLPGAVGQLGILPDHTEFMTSLGTGVLTYKKGGVVQSFNISGGLFTIINNKAVVLVDSLLATVTSIEDARRREKSEKQPDATGPVLRDS